MEDIPPACSLAGGGHTVWNGGGDGPADHQDTLQERQGHKLSMVVQVAEEDIGW